MSRCKKLKSSVGVKEERGGSDEDEVEIIDPPRPKKKPRHVLVVDLRLGSASPAGEFFQGYGPGEAGVSYGGTQADAGSSALCQVTFRTE
jgi:hypothetical protein